MKLQKHHLLLLVCVACCLTCDDIDSRERSEAYNYVSDQDVSHEESFMAADPQPTVRVLMANQKVKGFKQLDDLQEMQFKEAEKKTVAFKGKANTQNKIFKKAKVAKRVLATDKSATREESHAKAAATVKANHQKHRFLRTQAKAKVTTQAKDAPKTDTAAFDALDHKDDIPSEEEMVKLRAAAKTLYKSKKYQDLVEKQRLEKIRNDTKVEETTMTDLAWNWKEDSLKLSILKHKQVEVKKGLQDSAGLNADQLKTFKIRIGGKDMSREDLVKEDAKITKEIEELEKRIPETKKALAVANDKYVTLKIAQHMALDDHYDKEGTPKDLRVGNPYRKREPVSEDAEDRYSVAYLNEINANLEKVYGKIQIDDNKPPTPPPEPLVTTPIPENGPEPKSSGNMGKLGLTSLVILLVSQYARFQ